ncbi:hypothetical protein [Vibrio mimicus]|uniref:Tetratricopeptide repeat protein n=1 Tax=Vibrio mimicus TaxID=674 RepID=A0A1D8SHL7_VIBMI|nr:hypothetical protein [Vibrio mimicus]ERM52599.1 hypothetical protein P780_18915 [Vibrio mimicus CAIM 1882]ERM52728.1 hypothetical protein P781_18835 [Vibrio mimicus CAIM 1883]AOW84871.1 hypothetical protein VM_19560 [Vibrio mimicus]EEW09881.1 conserved hypothetical protein [Vibrio mimicus VM573]EGU19906.1 hypothetical protein SX4_2554 [Vibrio mimicus SX-4]
MDLQQCWNGFLQAEQLLKQGHWSQAHYLLEDVLHFMPQHIQSAAHDEQTKPCQMACMVTGLRDAAIAQAEIFNKTGQYQRAFDALNQAYALLQFLSIEEIDLMRRLNPTLCQISEHLLQHLNAFCYAQRSAEWQLEYQQVEKAHFYFNQLRSALSLSPASPVIN